MRPVKEEEAEGAGGVRDRGTHLQMLFLCFGSLTHAAKSVLNGLAHSHTCCYVITS